MFGRRKVPFGAAPFAPAPPPPPGDDWPPLHKMDGALAAAIRFFTRALEQAGRDCGTLGLPGEPAPDVAKLLADCVVYDGDGGAEFLTLGLTPDFVGFSYQPHCHLFLMLNAVLVLKDLPPSPLRAQIALAEVPGALVDAHMMRRWIRAIRPTGSAFARRDFDALDALLRGLIEDTMALGRTAPGWMTAQIDFEARSREWCSGYPGTIGRPLTADVPRINALPMSPFVEQLLTDYLVKMQMQGVAARS